MNRQERIEKFANVLGVNVGDVFKMKNYTRYFKVDKERGFVYFDEDDGCWKDVGSFNINSLYNDSIQLSDLITGSEKMLLRNLLSQYKDKVLYIQKIPFNEDYFKLRFILNRTFTFYLPNGDPIESQDYIDTDLLPRYDSFVKLEMFESVPFEILGIFTEEDK